MKHLVPCLALLLFCGPAQAQSSPVLPNGSDRAPAVTLMLPSADGTRAMPPSSANPLFVGGISGPAPGVVMAITAAPVTIVTAAPVSRVLLEITNTGQVEIDCSMGGTPLPGSGNYDPLLGYGSQMHYASPGFVPTNAVTCTASAAGAVAYVKVIQQ